jgi:hypothetical protein
LDLILSLQKWFLFYGSCLFPSHCKHHLLQLDALYNTNFYSRDLSSIFFNFFSRLSHLQKKKGTAQPLKTVFKKQLEANHSSNLKFYVCFVTVTKIFLPVLSCVFWLYGIYCDALHVGSVALSYGVGLDPCSWQSGMLFLSSPALFLTPYHCVLQVHPHLLESKGYGITTQPGSPNTN